MFLHWLTMSGGIEPSIDWEAFAAWVAVLLALISFGVRGLTARSRYHKRWFDDRKQLEAAIEAEHVVPALLRLILQVWPHDAALGSWVSHREEEAATAYADELGMRLQSGDVLDRLGELRVAQEDHLAAARAYQDLLGHARRSGQFAMGSVGLGLLVAADATITGVDLPRFGQQVFIVCVVLWAMLVIAASIYFFRESRAESRLVGLQEKYA